MAVQVRIYDHWPSWCCAGESPAGLAGSDVSADPQDFCEENRDVTKREAQVHAVASPGALGGGGSAGGGQRHYARTARSSGRGVAGAADDREIGRQVRHFLWSTCRATRRWWSRRGRRRFSGTQLRSSASGKALLELLESQAGVAPNQIESVCLGVLPPNAQGGEPTLVITRTGDREAADKLWAKLTPGAKRELYDGKEYWRREHGGSAYRPDDAR